MKKLHMMIKQSELPEWEKEWERLKRIEKAHYELLNISQKYTTVLEHFSKNAFLDANGDICIKKIRQLMKKIEPDTFIG